MYKSIDSYESPNEFYRSFCVIDTDSDYLPTTMKLSLVVLAVFIGVVCATPSAVEPDFWAPVVDSEIVQAEPSLVRHKRFTCDLLSFGARGLKGWNHAACAAKCTATRHRGGHCSGADCKCGKKW